MTEDTRPRVADIMKTDVTTCRASDRVDAICDMMRRGRFRHVPVVDDENKVVGILADRDVRAASFATSERAPSVGDLMVADIPVSEIMVNDPVTVSADMTVADALDLMKEKRISCLPVVDDGKLVGIAAGADFLSLLRRLVDEE